MNDLRRIPSIDSLLNSDEAISLIHDYGRDQVLFSLRHVLDELRTRSKLKEDNFSKKFIFEQTKAKLIKVFSPTLISVINATGVILHTNLGRAPLSNETIQSMQTIGSSYNTLEYDLVNGKRGSRSIHAEEILKQLTGAESATIVNNNASAVLLVLSSLANRKKVVISRTQLIEIGGGFRIPDVMKQSGAKLIEIGTTNRVHLRDYEEALQQPAALIMRAHHSNFKITGFTSEPDLKEICDLAHQFGIPVIDDLGSGTLIDTVKFGLTHEPTVFESLNAGVDIVTFSGDKLLGGPQAGIILGRKNLIDKIKKHPLARAIRPDKTCLAGLTSTLIHYLRNEAEIKIPVWQMISKTPKEIFDIANQWKEFLGFGEVTENRSTIGGGSMPGETLPTYVLSLAVKNPDYFLKQARLLNPPIIARIENDQVLLDPRTVFSTQEEQLLIALKSLLPEKFNYTKSE